MTDTLAVEQAKTKPKLEDVIKVLDIKLQKNVLAFLDYCKAKNIIYPWSSTNRWTLKIKGKPIGGIGVGKRVISDNSWYAIADLRGMLQYDDALQKEGLTEIILNNIKQCDGCAGCGPGRTAKILGKEFNNVCGTAVSFKNPDTDALEDFQKVLNFRMAIPQGTQSRPFTDPQTEGLVRIDNKQHVNRISDLEGNSSENLNRLFDGKYVEKYYVWPYGEFKTTENIHEILFELDEPAELKMYSLVTAMRPDVPQKWTLYGSASKTEPWIQLDVRESFPKPVTNYTEKAFEIDEPGVYQYYRITFEGRNFVISQIHLYTK
ncbi:MAG: hypothetical protein LBD23_07530 [Oscillospiraceae bacterium]|jgi:hypothetical protein|nr:hypothetical protein [Oscillospiraceae bacterium]